VKYIQYNLDVVSLISVLLIWILLSVLPCFDAENISKRLGTQLLKKLWNASST